MTGACCDRDNENPVLIDVRNLAPALAVMTPDMRDSTAMSLTMRLDAAFGSQEITFEEYSQAKIMIGTYAAQGATGRIHYG